MISTFHYHLIKCHNQEQHNAKHSQLKPAKIPKGQSNILRKKCVKKSTQKAKKNLFFFEQTSEFVKQRPTSQIAMNNEKSVKQQPTGTMKN
jgi:hypothetical protein